MSASGLTFEADEFFEGGELLGGGTPAAESIAIVWEGSIVPLSAKPLTLFT
jgi:hypothetical protein